MSEYQGNIREGAVGFFDILGYQSLLENNKTEEDLNNIAFKVLETINKIQTEDLTNITFARGSVSCGAVVKCAVQVVNKTAADNQLATLENIKPINEEDKKYKCYTRHEKTQPKNNPNSLVDKLVFSDTILLSLDFSRFRSDGYSDIELWILFLESCEKLYNDMFNAGLPLRGAIDFGKYIINVNSFVGSPIVAAYKLSNKLDMSACVLTKDAAHKLNEIFSKHGFAIEYLIPTKDREEKLFTLGANPCDQNKDIREQVLSSFWKHNKDIPLSVKSKVDNTVQWLTYLRMKENENKA